MKSNDWRHKNVARYTPGNTKILYFFNCLLDGMHTKIQNSVTLLGYSVLVGILFLTRLQIFNIPFYLKMLQTGAVLLAIGTLSIGYLCKSENNLWIQVMNCRLIYINSLFVKISNQIVQLEEDEPDRNYKRGMRKRYV